MNKWGMHGPNHEPLNIAEMCGLGGDCYVVVDKWGQVWTIRDLRPNALILLRAYWGSCSLYDDPVDRARWCADFLEPYLWASKHMVIGNEFNTEAEGFAEDDIDGWRRLNDWIVASVTEFKRLVPDAVMHWPALSPWFGDYPPHLDPPGLTYCQESIALCDVFDAHIYWHPDNPDWAGVEQARRMERLHHYAPNKYMFVSEAGPLDMRHLAAAEQITRWFRILEAEFPYVLGAAPFMWNWGPEHPELNYYDKPTIKNSMRTAPKQEFALPSSWVYEEEEPPMNDVIRVLRFGLPESIALEEYLRGVVPAEVPALWHEECLKAQAVAARSYAMRAVGRPRHTPEADVCDGPHCQAYRQGKIHERTDGAVAATNGLHLQEEGGDIYLAQYISKCGLDICPYCEGSGGWQFREWPGRMCQWGAKTLADRGRDFRNILLHYYPDAIFSDDSQPPPSLEGRVERLEGQAAYMAGVLAKCLHKNQALANFARQLDEALAEVIKELGG